ncbi:hypothetical protein GLA29479_2740 [Lysobacter antibioticus]|uniref:Uncharacterized protein n=1 Tax=Lysobacter antibioticus TaxID=84531 RepID=A0A0S2DYG8_LYSAN|nr:hypothetical protein GLA29479_2740 [Lysobacter antibioticus]ALN80524.1 hypothetical protein LA76x_2394 [Lysobacter antibioticus]
MSQARSGPARPPSPAHGGFAADSHKMRAPRPDRAPAPDR